MLNSVNLDDKTFSARTVLGYISRAKDAMQSGADYLALARRENTSFQTAAAAFGSKVVLVQYTGRGDLAEHLDDIVAMIE